MTHYTENCSTCIDASPSGLTDVIAHTVRQWLKQQRLRASVQRERADLLTMSDAMLRDIGIDRATAEHEALRTDLPAGRGD